MDQRSQGNDVLISFTKVQHFKERLASSGRFKKRFLGKVDAVVFGDVVDGLRRELPGEGTDPHGGENRTTRGEITPEGAV